MGCASSSVLIADGGGGELKHQSEKIPRDESLSFRDLSRQEPRSRNRCCFHSLFMTCSVFPPLLLFIHLGTPE